MLEKLRPEKKTYKNYRLEIGIWCVFYNLGKTLISELCKHNSGVTWGGQPRCAGGDDGGAAHHGGGGSGPDWNASAYALTLAWCIRERNSSTLWN